MKTHNSQIRGGMPFVLASTLLSQAQHLEDSLLARINLISLIFSIVRAILDASGLPIKEKDLPIIKETEDCIEALRDSYEPFMDDPEGRETAGNKRKSAEKMLDLTRYQIMYLITKYELIDSSIMKTIQGVDWE